MDRIGTIVIDRVYPSAGNTTVEGAKSIRAWRCNKKSRA
jgi:hypothetical protein